MHIHISIIRLVGALGHGQSLSATLQNGCLNSSNPQSFLLDLKKQAFASNLSQVYTTSAINIKSEPSQKRFDPEVTVEQTDTWLENDYVYSTYTP